MWIYGHRKELHFLVLNKRSRGILRSLSLYLIRILTWQVRPVVETGYENLLLVRLLLETRLPSIRKSLVGISVCVFICMHGFI